MHPIRPGVIRTLPVPLPLSLSLNIRTEEEKRRRALPTIHHLHQSSSESLPERLSLVLPNVFPVPDWIKEAYIPHAIFLFKSWMIHNIDPLLQATPNRAAIGGTSLQPSERTPKPLSLPSYPYLAPRTATSVPNPSSK